MKPGPLLTISATILVFAGMTATADSPIAIAIHGGAGTISRATVTVEQEQAIRESLLEAVNAAYQVLKNDGDSMDAVISAIKILENSPHFNAGKGSVFTWDGKNEMDAALMDGASLDAGAISGVTNIANPIVLARLVMQNSKHVFLSGDGAVEFATEQGMEKVPDEYFFTERRWQQLQDLKDNRELAAAEPQYGIGTVGAVALDRRGNLVAGTSTGGTTGKRYGRIGDSPIIGSGTYANNRSVAVSATGTGEFFIRGTVAHDISALVEYKGMTVDDAAREVIFEKLVALKGDGGVIAMDRHGNISMPFNTVGMYRASIDTSGKVNILLYDETAETD
ncbi:MAG: isoaspartyl peptidase/L-asparaginase [Proteobacteria bacterium]|nr:isoaspartyl peptidase/L-asparaginase [Pseudomonadota bacterium]